MPWVGPKNSATEVWIADEKLHKLLDDLAPTRSREGMGGMKTIDEVTNIFFFASSVELCRLLINEHPFLIGTPIRGEFYEVVKNWHRNWYAEFLAHVCLRKRDRRRGDRRKATTDQRRKPRKLR